ncbi:MAG TPA: TlpA disulfide reductase family protein [Nocardioidaceae bacterium]|nr:TlpA disulfide reductase family protein [Nocardioidaceae bacterium]
MRRSRPAALAPVLAGLLLVVLAACAGSGDAAESGGDAGSVPDPFSATPPPASSVEVATPELRALKRQAGIEPCPDTEPAAPAETTSDGLPAVTLPCLGGGQDVHLADLSGPMVVNLWASWCAPCREELPVLQEYAEMAAGRVEVIGIDFMDTRPGAALELARQSDVTYPLLADIDAELRAPLRVVSMPMTYVVDEDGRIARTMLGQIHSVDDLDAAVEAAIGVSVGG